MHCIGIRGACESGRLDDGGGSAWLKERTTVVGLVGEIA
jgi:hypothetical protein